MNIKERILFEDNHLIIVNKEAKELVIRAGKASASFIQRRLRIGYARAARLIDMLEEEGVVGTEKQEEKKQK